MAVDIVALVQRFEPLLHFHQDERFFPSDAKRYMEQSELWPAVGDLSVDNGAQRTLKENWGSLAGDHRIPMLARGTLAAEAGELGSFIGTSGPFVADDGLEERFLNLAGWRGGDIVDPTSENGYADLDRIFTLYNSDPANGGNPILAASQFWYHAEFFTADRLRALLRPQIRQGDALLQLLDGVASDPALLCYYFFFPGHVEGLTGCFSNAATSWASCAGAWQCLAILLNRDNPGADYEPKFAATTNRLFRAKGFVGLEPRVGMISNVRSWETIAAVGEHPMLFVANGTHGLYFSNVDATFIMSAPDDPSVRNCGVYEGIAGFDSDKGSSDSDSILLTKVLGGAGLFGAVGAIGPGALVGLIAAAIEGDIAAQNLSTSEGEPSIDELPKNQIGRVVRPPKVNSPLAPDAPGPIWPRFDDDPNNPLMTISAGRRCSLIVGTGADPFGQSSRPAWLPSDDGASGFRGRWGNRVTRDPFSRRAGARFPDFANMFLRALAVELSS
jgi:hypothetical protein